MKSIFRFLWFISLFFVLIFESFAIEAPVNVEIESSTESSVILTWEPLENAIMYYVYYSKESWLISDYDNYSDLVDWNSVEITELEEWQNYYFAVTSLDENWEESVYSEEVVLDVNAIDTSISNDAVIEELTEELTAEVTTVATDIDFVLDWVSVIAYDKIELIFTNPLDDSVDAIREFKIVNKFDSFDTFEVVSTELDEDDHSIIELMLDRETQIGNQYEVVIIAISSSTGRNIESWVDNVESFTVTELAEIVEEEAIVEEEVELNSAWTEETSLIWTNIDASEIENTTLAQAENQTELPQTWPEHVLILILSIILWAFVFIFKYKRA